MRTKYACYVSLVIGLLILLNGFNAQGQKIKVKVSEIKSGKGKLIISIYKDREAYTSDKPLKKMEFAKKGLVNGALELNFTIEPGSYGITLLDDEDGDSEMDKNLMGIPKEGFGFSNFYLDKMKRPTFDEFKTEIKAGENTVMLRLKYM